MRIKTFIIFAIMSISGLNAQELKCEVKVNAQNRVQIADPQVFKDLERQLFEFVNNRKWTSEVYKIDEKIECSIVLTITNELAQDKYKATLSVQSNRPIHNSSYKSVLLNHSDKDVAFTYSQYQQLEFNENAHLSNLTSVVAYYINIMLGLDYDSFSEMGGTPYFDKAQSIVNNAQGESDVDAIKGWKAFDGTRNRYWLIKQITDADNKPFRSAYYKYHRQGLDKMYDNISTGRATILAGLSSLKQVNDRNPNSMLLQVYFFSKRLEYKGVFSDAPPNEKAKAVQLLSILDATNASEYRKIMK